MSDTTRRGFLRILGIGAPAAVATAALTKLPETKGRTEPIVRTQFETYAAIGNREELMDAIYNVEPLDFPLSKVMKK